MGRLCLSLFSVQLGRVACVSLSHGVWVLAPLGPHAPHFHFHSEAEIRHLLSLGIEIPPLAFTYLSGLGQASLQSRAGGVLDPGRKLLS